MEYRADDVIAIPTTSIVTFEICSFLPMVIWLSFAPQSLIDRPGGF
jgi:hypothetical protein